MNATAAIDDELADFAYAVAWRAGGQVVGVHSSRSIGSGSEFHDFVPFERHPDGRRIDVRASARDPYGRLQVRRFETRNRIAVHVVVDVSASMGFLGQSRKPEIAGAVAAAVAAAARRIGDRFALTVVDGEGRSERTQALGPAPAAEIIAATVAGYRPAGKGTRGLLEAAAGLAGRRALVFLVSDFRFPVEDLGDLLDRLGNHDVVPVEVIDPAETDWPTWGLAEVADLETGQVRLAVLRPALVRRMNDERAARDAALRRLFAERGRRPFRVVGRLDLSAFAEHLLEV